MPRRETGALTRVVSQLSAKTAAVEAQREPHAQFWDAWNAEAAKADGPLWIVLGDSSSQGIGSADPSQSWVPLVHERLRGHTGDPWRVINLAITGAQFGDIVRHELPRVDQLTDAGHQVDLVTHLAGANNLMAPATWPNASNDLRIIMDAIPPRSVVARVGVHHAANTLMARHFNRIIEASAREKQFELFWPWKWPSLDGMGDDKWHPGPKGYGYMADILFDRVTASLTR